MEQKNKSITITLLGGIEVGKTTLINMYLGQEFTDLALITMGNDKFKTKIKINNNFYNLIIWDTGGIERLRLYSINTAISSDIIIFVFDVTNSETYKDIKYWTQSIKAYMSSDIDKISVIIIGNKIDSIEREV